MKTKNDTTKRAVNNNTAKVATPVRTLKKVDDQGKEEPAKKEETKKPDSPAVLTVEERKERLAKLNVIAARHQQLKGREKEFFDFRNADDGSNSRLLLSNGNGLSFEVTNSEVIETTIQTLQSQLDGKIKETEKELLAFEV